MSEGTRSKLVTWADPAALREAGKTMTRLELIQAMIDGRLPGPPMAALMGYRPVEARAGYVVYEGMPGEEHYNTIGSVHGGFAATLLDTVMGAAVQTKLAPGWMHTTLEMKVNLLRGISKDTGPLRAISTALHVGRRTALAEARLVDAEDKLYAHGSSTCLVIPPKPAAGG
jgi:uncharacterized protein (TIGR00369 family)